MKKVYICSPLRGDIEGNIERAKGYCKQAICEGCFPIAPHIYFTQFMDDTIAEERELAMAMGIELLDMCNELWVFGDTISEGMRAEIDYFEEHYNRKIVYKKIEEIGKRLDVVESMFKDVLGEDIKFVDVTEHK